MRTELKQTNYVVVVDYREGQTLEDCWLLGWNNKYDWYDCDTCGDEILTPTGRVKKNNGIVIDIDRWVGVYVSETEEWCRECSNDGNKEGYDCTVCKLEKSSDGWLLVPIYEEES